MSLRNFQEKVDTFKNKLFDREALVKREIFEYEEWLEDRNYNDCRAFLNEFLEDIDSSNGDGQDYVEFIVLNKSRK